MANHTPRSTYTRERATEVLELIASGLTVEQACQGGAVPLGTFTDWVRGLGLSEAEGGWLSTAYARARVACDEVYAGQIVSIPDALPDTATSAQVARAKLRSEARRWMVSRRLPDQYGDRLALGSKDGQPLNVTVWAPAPLAPAQELTEPAPIGTGAAPALLGSGQAQGSTGAGQGRSAGASRRVGEPGT